jgi:hypothetical protein
MGRRVEVGLMDVTQIWEGWVDHLLVRILHGRILCVVFVEMLLSSHEFLVIIAFRVATLVQHHISGGSLVHFPSRGPTLGSLLF